MKVSTYCHLDQQRLLQFCVLRPVEMIENTGFQELSDNAFYVRQIDDKLRIKNKDRPPSLLPNLIAHNRTKADRHVKYFCICQ